MSGPVVLNSEGGSSESEMHMRAVHEQLVGSRVTMGEDPTIYTLGAPITAYPNGCPILPEGPQRDDL